MKIIEAKMIFYFKDQITADRQHLEEHVDRL